MYEEFYKIIDKKEELGCSYEKSAKYLEQITTILTNYLDQFS